MFSCIYNTGETIDIKVINRQKETHKKYVNVAP